MIKLISNLFFNKNKILKFIKLINKTIIFTKENYINGTTRIFLFLTRMFEVYILYSIKYTIGELVSFTLYFEWKILTFDERFINFRNIRI